MSKLLFKLMEEIKGDGTPAGAPAVEPQQEAPAVESQDTGADWADLSSEVEEVSFEDDSIEQPPAEGTTKTEQPETPEVQKSEQAADVAIQPEQQAPVGQPYTPEMVAQAESMYVSQLERLYQVDEDTALKLQTEPEKILPHLAARLHLDVMKTVMAQMQGLLPQVVEQTNKTSVREGKAKDMFFSAWPELQGYEQQVMQVGTMFRQMNPSADPATAVQRIGELAMAALGMQRQAAAQAQPQQPAMFKPAGAGRAAPAAKPASVWDDLIADDD